MMYAETAAQVVAAAVKQPPDPPSVISEVPAGAIRIKPDAPITPFSAPMPAPDPAPTVPPPAPEPLSFPSIAAVGPAAHVGDGDTPVDEGNRLPVDLPELSAPVATAPQGRPAPGRGGMALRQLPWWARMGADVMSALRLLAESITFYSRTWRPLLPLVAILLIPVTATKSCVVAAVMGSAVPSPLVEGSATAVDFSRVKQELIHRIDASRAEGKIDKAATAELTALQSVSAAGAVGVDVPVQVPSSVAMVARWIASALLTGLLLFGLAVPLAYASLTVALVDQRAGSPLPSFMDVGVMLWNRRLRFVTALLPAAAIVAVGSALFLLPGVIAAGLLLFVPVVVLFERAAGKAALLRSMALVRTDAVRVLVVMLAAAVLGAAFSGLADLALPESNRRIMVFLRIFLGDLLLIATLPVPALAAARLYIDLRGREGVDEAALAKAARR